MGVRELSRGGQDVLISTGFRLDEGRWIPEWETEPGFVSIVNCDATSEPCSSYRGTRSKPPSQWC